MENDDSQIGDAHSPAVRVSTAAETVKHLQQAILWSETMQTDYVKIMHLWNFLAIANHAHYDWQKQTKLPSFPNTIDIICTFISMLNELTANGVTMWEKTALFHVYRAFISV